MWTRNIKVRSDGGDAVRRRVDIRRVYTPDGEMWPRVALSVTSGASMALFPALDSDRSLTVGAHHTRGPGGAWIEVRIPLELVPELIEMLEEARAMVEAGA